MADTFGMEDRRNWPNTVGRKFDKFWQWKLPCPVDPVDDIYRNAFTAKEWACIRYLRQEKPKTLKQQDGFSLFWTPDTSGTSSCPHISFEFPNGTMLPRHPVMLDELPSRVQAELRTWITSVNYFRSLRRELVARCKGIMGNPTGEGRAYTRRRYSDLDPKCNSPRQLYRIWPEVQPMMMTKWKRHVQHMKVRSRLPSHVGYRVHRDDYQGTWGRWATPEEFRAEDAGAPDIEKKRFREINQILTMVSLADQVPDLDDYPSFYGSVD